MKTPINKGTPESSLALMHGVHVVLVICGALIAWQATLFMRGHHSAVSPHSGAEGFANLLLWAAIPIALIVLPLVRVSRRTCVQTPPGLKLVLWSAFAVFIITITTAGNLPWHVIYPATTVFAYLFASDAISAFRSRAWLAAAFASLGSLVSISGFLVVSWALLFAE